MKKWLLFAAVTLVLTGCGSEKKEEAHQHQSTDLQEKTKDASTLPTFLANHDDNLKLVYEASAKAPDVLAAMPCYCGCGESAGHKSSLNCFVADIEEDGAVVWDDHGTRCATCVNIAFEAIQLVKIEGKSLKEARQMIDTKYKEGYAKPTPTPMPS